VLPPIPAPTINPGGVMKRAAAPKPAKLTPQQVKYINAGMKKQPTRLAPRPGPTAPAQPQSAATTAAVTAPSPLDATYYGNVASNQFGVNNQINTLNLQSDADRTALQAALGKLAQQQPSQQLALEQGANQRGALYSSVYDTATKAMAQDFADQQVAAQNTSTGQQQSIASQIAALQGGIPIYNNQEALASALRAANAAASDATLGQAPIAAAKPAAPKKAAPKKAAPKKAAPKKAAPKLGRM
jgi:hypothetical protein